MVLLGILFAIPLNAKEDKSSRGYLDKTYTADSLDGRIIQFQGIAKGNARIERTLEVAAQDGSALPMDSLYEAFNARLVHALLQKLPKARWVRADTASRSGAIPLRRLIGEEAFPDSFAISVPPPAGGADLSLVVGKAVFGVRSQQVLRYRYHDDIHSPHHPFGPNGIRSKFPPAPKFKQRFYLEDYDPLDQEEPQHPYVDKVKQKRFYTILEFCFYDHRAQRAFGYGWDGVETDFRGELGKFLLGKKVDLETHMRKQADNLAGLFLGKSALARHYRDTEIVLVKRKAPPPETIREELEADEEE